MSVERDQDRVSSANRDGSQTQNRSAAAGGSACPQGRQLATKDLAARGQTEPQREVRGAFRRVQVRSALSHQLEDQR